ncbi:MAG TPA: hypothetical protein VE177_07800, partial [Candidatus Binatus sp.]|nr:hypothetical protein [Candidatus Binatus sp.]
MWSRFHSTHFLVPILGTLFIDAWYLSASLFFVLATGQLPFFVYFWMPFMIGLPITALVTWYRPKIGYLVYAILAGLGLILFSDGGHGVEVYATPSNSAQFFDVITTLPTYLAILIYSILGFRSTLSRRAGKVEKTIPRSSFAAFLIMGFIIGGLVVGLMAGATEARLISGAGSQADIFIVNGASQLGTTAYSPDNYTVKV